MADSAEDCRLPFASAGRADPGVQVRQLRRERLAAVVVLGAIQHLQDGQFGG